MLHDQDGWEDQHRSEEEKILKTTQFVIWRVGYLAEIAVPDAGRGSRLEKTMRGQPSPPLFSFSGEPADKKYILQQRGD